jgi:ABC-type transport system involved in cytochrome bd biosynthesis fused ATPase/permease subunit
MHRNSGTTSMRGQVAYVPQQPWIQNLTLKNNVLFGRSLNTKLYDKVLESCALTIDLESLPAGDQTEIGEKVVFISVGLGYLTKAISRESTSVVVKR